MTAPKRRWGKAGVPLTDTEARRNDQRRDRSRHLRVADEQEAYRKWDAGLLVPARITTALDLQSLEGPEVDAACGAAEPDVDRWEAGELYPTWEQLRLLSELTGLALRFFFLPPPEPVWTTLDYHLPAPDLQERLPVARFLPGARDAKRSPVQGQDRRRIGHGLRDPGRVAPGRRQGDRHPGEWADPAAAGQAPVR